MSYEQATTHTTFKTSIRHVLGEVLLVLVLEAVILFVGLLIAGFSGMAVENVVSDSPYRPFLSPCVTIVIFFFIIVPFVWLFAKHRLKFTLHIGQDNITFGRWPFRECTHCMDVETIYEKCGKVDNPSSYYVVITGYGKKWSCFFERNSPACIRALRAVCLNAVVIDVYGNEHLPQKTESAATVIRNLIRTRYARAATAFMIALPCLAWSSIIVWAVIHKFINGTTLAEAVDGFPAGMIAILLLGCTTLATAVYQLRQALVLSKRVKTHMPQSVEEFIFQKSMEGN